MTKTHNRQIMKTRRKELRKNATPEEKLFWNILRNQFSEYRFRRQFSVGFYILDFYSPQYKIGIKNHDIHRDLLKVIEVLRVLLEEFKQTNL